MQTEIKIEAAKATGAIALTGASAITLNQVLMAMTICYVMLQMAYLIWKWRREAKAKPL